MMPAHILLVEDNEGDILLTLDAFEEGELGPDISVVKNGQDALDFVFKKGTYKDAKKPDLILLDINIPIFNGHEVLRQIKKDSDIKKIPVVVLTTSSNPNDIKLAYENHANSYVKKPLEMDEFLNTILLIEKFWLQLSTLAGQ